jgi:hypothetical protein
MKKLIVTTLFLMLCAVFALAQTSSTNPSSSSTSSTSQSGTNAQSGNTTSSGSQDTTTPSTSSSSTAQDTMGNKSQSSASNKNDKEKTITGCLESAGSSGQYMIRHKNKEVTIVPSSAVGSEIASHVGEKVKLRGSWEQASASNSTASNTSSNLPQSDQPGGTAGTSGTSNTSGTSGMSKADKNASREFRANSIEKVSGTCGGNNNKSKSDNSSNPKP